MDKRQPLLSKEFSQLTGDSVDWNTFGLELRDEFTQPLHGMLLPLP